MIHLTLGSLNFIIKTQLKHENAKHFKNPTSHYLNHLINKHGDEITFHFSPLKTFTTK